jgi:hypothetical protein
MFNRIKTFFLDWKEEFIYLACIVPCLISMALVWFYVVDLALKGFCFIVIIIVLCALLIPASLAAEEY